MKTHREKEGLLGPVHTVRVHVEKLPAKIARPSTSGQTLEQMITFDPEGRKTEETTCGENDAKQKARSRGRLAYHLFRITGPYSL
jgi:hypothetical protein